MNVVKCCIKARLAVTVHVLQLIVSGYDGVYSKKSPAESNTSRKNTKSIFLNMTCYVIHSWLIITHLLCFYSFNWLSHHGQTAILVGTFIPEKEERRVL